MKIGMFLDSSYPPDPRIENEAISLIKNGHQVVLFSLDYANKSKYEIINGIEVFRYSQSRKLFKKIYALAYTIPLYRIILEPLIKKFIQKNKIDVIHVHNIAIAGPVFNVNKKFGLPIVLDLHENLPVIMRYYPGFRSIWGRILIDLKKWERKQQEFVAKADYVAVVTQEAKKDLLEYNNQDEKNIIELPNTIILDHFLKNKIKSEIVKKYESDFVILYLGDTGLRRGIDTAIKAVNLLKSKIPTIKLVLVGKSRDDAAYKSVVNKMGIGKYVDFVGWQNEKLFPSYIEASDICISPLKRNRHHDTTYANKLFQYMSLGKPLIVSDSTAQAKLICELKSGLIHEANNENDLAEKIFKLYNNPQLRQTMGSNGESAVEKKYNWDISSISLLKIYDELNHRKR